MAPDANPYLVMYSLVKTGLDGVIQKRGDDKRPRVRYLPGTIQTAILQFRQSDWTKELLGEEYKQKYLQLKQAVADRSPVELGTRVKMGEVIYHHEVYNQLLWNQF